MIPPTTQWSNLANPQRFSRVSSPMVSSLQNYTAAHRYVLETVAHAANFVDPVAFTAGSFHWPLLKAARKGPKLPIDGVLVPDWDISQRGAYPGIRLGARVYDL